MIDDNQIADEMIKMDTCNNHFHISMMTGTFRSVPALLSIYPINCNYRKQRKCKLNQENKRTKIFNMNTCLLCRYYDNKTSVGIMTIKLCLIVIIPL